MSLFSFIRRLFSRPEPEAPMEILERTYSPSDRTHTWTYRYGDERPKVVLKLTDGQLVRGPIGPFTFQMRIESWIEEEIRKAVDRIREERRQGIVDAEYEVE